MVMGRKILIIDGDKDIHKFIKSELSYFSSELDPEASSGWGYNIFDEDASVSSTFEIDEAYQGTDGFFLIQRALENLNPYLVVFIDMGSPDGDGVKTAREIRKTDQTIQIVMITADSDLNRDKIVEQIGNQEKLIFLQKPFYQSEIKSLVSNISNVGFT
jgi:DNA-binding response OmpR family regulator